jgi:hypothetical protein
MTTIVSSLLTNVNYYNNNNIEKYIINGKKLLELELKKIIFIEEHVFDLYFKDFKNDNTIFYFINKKDLYFYEYINELINFNPITDNPEKDTIEYMFVQCNKTEWVRKAVELNPYNSEQFIWIDFGIYYIINNEDFFSKYIHSMTEKKYNNVRIASSGYDEYYLNMYRNYGNIYRSIIWFYMGSVFGGNKDKLILFANLMKNKCIDIMGNKKTICWEVNIWLIIYNEYPELFENYKCFDHGVNLITNY